MLICTFGLVCCQVPIVLNRAANLLPALAGMTVPSARTWLTFVCRHLACLTDSMTPAAPFFANNWKNFTSASTCEQVVDQAE